MLFSVALDKSGTIVLLKNTASYPDTDVPGPLYLHDIYAQLQQPQATLDLSQTHLEACVSSAKFKSS